MQQRLQLEGPTRVSTVTTEREALDIAWQVKAEFPKLLPDLGEANSYRGLQYYKKKPRGSIAVVGHSAEAAAAAAAKGEGDKVNIDITFGKRILTIGKINIELAEIIADIVCDANPTAVVFFDTAPDNARDPMQPRMMIYNVRATESYMLPVFHDGGQPGVQILMGKELFRIYRSIFTDAPKANEYIVCKQDMQETTNSFRDYRWKTIGKGIVLYINYHHPYLSSLMFDVKRHISEFL